MRGLRLRLACRCSTGGEAGLGWGAVLRREMRAGTTCGEEGMPWWLGYSMWGAHPEAETTIEPSAAQDASHRLSPRNSCNSCNRISPVAACRCSPRGSECKVCRVKFTFWNLCVYVADAEKSSLTEGEEEDSSSSSSLTATVRSHSLSHSPRPACCTQKPATRHRALSRAPLCS